MITVRYVRYFAKPFIAALIMGASAFGVHRLLLPIGNALATLISIGCGVVVYFALVVILKIFSKEELSSLPIIKKFVK